MKDLPASVLPKVLEMEGDKTAENETMPQDDGAQPEKRERKKLKRMSKERAKTSKKSGQWEWSRQQELTTAL